MDFFSMSYVEKLAQQCNAVRSKYRSRNESNIQLMEYMTLDITNTNANSSKCVWCSRHALTFEYPMTIHTSEYVENKHMRIR